MTDSNKSVNTSKVQPEETSDVEKYGSDIVTCKNEAADDDSKFPTGIALWSILGPVTIAYFLVFLDMCVVSTATPAITERFNSLVDVGWYGGAYQLGSSALQPLTGKIYSHFNIKVGRSFCGFFKRDQSENLLTVETVVLPRLLLYLRARVRHMWSCCLLAHVHCR